MAGQGVEREFKLELPDAGARARLLAALGPVATRTARQVNHFFDSAAGALRASRLALRLREEEGRWFLTLKGPRSGAGSLATRAEEERELEPRRAAELLAGEADPLAELEPTELVARARDALRGQPLVRLGSFVNERLRVGPIVLGAVPVPLVLELDHTHFPDGIAHELEVELPPGVEPEAVECELRALLERLSLPWRPAGNKAARFFRALEARRAARDTQD